MMHDESGVHPVIGILLMVAVVVILATIIIGIMFIWEDMDCSVEKTITVVSICERDSSTETVVTDTGERYTFIGLLNTQYVDYPRPGTYNVCLNDKNEIIDYTPKGDCTNFTGPCSGGCGFP